MTDRRDFLQQGALAATAWALSARSRQIIVGGAPRLSSFLDVVRQPDLVRVESDKRLIALRPVSGRWESGDILVTCSPSSHAMRLAVAAPATAITRIHLRWHGRLDGVLSVMGDAWERAYGDLEWRGPLPDRILPWYAATWDGIATHAYGVRTGSNAFVSWQIDPQGISL
jgi:alpha-galactosidase